MKLKYIIAVVCAILLSLGSNNRANKSETGLISNNYLKLDIQGHRGARGLYPENSLQGFIEAVKLGVTTLEMDVVISKDNYVVVSHDPFLSHEFCFGTDGKEITEETEKQFNLYRMNYEEIKQCDCGTKIHPRFPDQKKIRVYKPLLSEVIDWMEKYTKDNSLPAVHYNVEIKSTPEGDGTFHPKPEEFVKLLMDVIKEKNVWDRTNVQSFDVRPLQLIKSKYLPIRLALLVGDKLPVDEQLKKLGFVPDIYSPDYTLVNSDLINYCISKNMRVIPWTVNDTSAVKNLVDLGVNGIITDYPDRVIKFIKSRE